MFHRIAGLRGRGNNIVKVAVKDEKIKVSEGGA